jgi:hypothetical protein
MLIRSLGSETSMYDGRDMGSWSQVGQRERQEEGVQDTT